MSAQDIVYLDYAATAAVRPPEVVRAVARYMTEIGATPGRGGHRRAIEAGRVALRCRQALAELFNLPGDAGRIAFMFNATHALNTALRGVLGEGDAVVVTELDHNAVLRPVAALARERGVRVRTLAARPDGSIDLDGAAAALEGARLVVVNGASNVLGTALPVRELADRAHAAGAWVLVDAAQTAGHRPVDVQTEGIDLLAFTGHKGLLGPQGTGGLWVREGIDVEPLLRGGTGGDSRSEEMPPSYPDHLEAGTLNGPGIAGLAAGVEWLLGRPVDAVHRHESELKARLREGLSDVAGVRVLSPADPDGVGIVTLVSDVLAPPVLARRLDAEHGVLVRSGLHCAPGAHRVLGTQETGAVRLSVGWATTSEDVDRAVQGVERVVSTARSE